MSPLVWAIDHPYCLNWTIPKQDIMVSNPKYKESPNNNCWSVWWIFLNKYLGLHVAGFNNHVKNTHVWPLCMIPQGNHAKFARLVLLVDFSKLGSLDELARNKMKMSARKWRSLSDWVNNQSRGSYISDTCLSIFADSTIINSQKMIKYFSETNDVIPVSFGCLAYFA